MVKLFIMDFEYPNKNKYTINLLNKKEIINTNENNFWITVLKE